MADTLHLPETVPMVVLQYAHYADHGVDDEFRHVFTSDATLQVNGQNGTQVFRHTDLHTVPRRLRRHFQTTMHTVTNHLWQESGDRGEGTAYCVAHHVKATDDAVEDLVLHIKYSDVYARIERTWLLHHRTVDVLWTSTNPVTLPPPR